MRNQGSFRSVAVVVVVSLVAITAGCGGRGDQVDDVVTATPAEIETARGVFENETCGMCHGPEGEGTDLAPALENLGGYWDEQRLVRYLENPAAFRVADPSFDARRAEVYEMDMPSYDHVPESERRSVARWLLTR